MICENGILFYLLFFFSYGIESSSPIAWNYITVVKKDDDTKTYSTNGSSGQT